MMNLIVAVRRAEDVGRPHHRRLERVARDLRAHRRDRVVEALVVHLVIDTPSLLHQRDVAIVLADMELCGLEDGRHHVQHVVNRRHSGIEAVGMHDVEQRLDRRLDLLTDAAQVERDRRLQLGLFRQPLAELVVRSACSVSAMIARFFIAKSTSAYVSAVMDSSGGTISRILSPIFLLSGLMRSASRRAPPAPPGSKGCPRLHP